MRSKRERKLKVRINSSISRQKNPDELVNALRIVLETLARSHNLNYREVLEHLENGTTEILVPVSIFSGRSLGVLEALSKYLKEERNLRYNEIALLLNRDPRTIWTTYRASQEKNPGRLVIGESLHHIPVSVFSNRELGLLESLSLYLKEEKNLGYSGIARLLNRDPRTIWTACSRAGRKRGGRD